MDAMHTILRKIEDAKALDFGDIFNKSIELFKKVWLQGFLVVLLKGVLVIPLVFIVYIPMIAFGILSPETFEESNSFSELGSGGVLVVVISIILAIIISIMGAVIEVALKASYFRIVKNKDLKENVSDDYFFFLKRKYLKKTIILSIMMVGISLVSLLLFILPFFYALIPLTYMIVVYAMNPDLSEREIVKIAFALGNKKWFFTFLLVVIAWFLSTVVGVLMCFIGLYITQQFIDLSFYQVYKRTVGINKLEAIDEIGNPSE